MTKFEHFFKVMIKPWMVAIYMVIVVCSYFYIDKPVAIAAHAFQFNVRFPWLDALSDLGMGFFYMVFIAIVAFSIRTFFHNDLWERRAWFLWLCVVIPNVICLVLKMGLGRARPDMWFSAHMYGFYGLQKSANYWSFPSGHTTTIMGLVFGLGVLFPRYLFGFIVFGVLIAISRVLLIQHYVSDVLMASYLALIEVGLLYRWLSGHYNYEKKM